MCSRTRSGRNGPIRNLVAVGLVAGAVGVAAGAGPEEPTPGGDWPTYRHDAALSAVSPLKGGLARPPRVAWSVELGGPRVPSETVLVRDVTGDGRDEILLLGDDAVECRDARGRRLWRLDGYPRPAAVDVRDYAGDGSRGVLLSTTRGGRVETFLIDGRSGHATSLWRDENNFGGHTRSGKLLAGVPGAQVASTASGQIPPAPHGGSIRLVSFEDGLARHRFRVRQSLAGAYYSPLLLFDDFDTDGVAEMLVISHEVLWSFDTEDGREEFTARYAPMIRTYSASIASVKLSPIDPHPSLVVINPHIPGLRAVRQDGRSRAETLWKVVVGGKEDQYQSAVKIGPGGPDVASDLDGDGRYEVLASIANEHGDRSQHLVVFGAATGGRLAEAGDERVISVDDLDGDGRPEVLLRSSARLRLARWDGRGFVELWHGDGAEPLLRPLPAEGSLTRTSGGNAPVWRDAPGSDLFLLRFPDGVGACRLSGKQVIRVRPAATHEALGNVGDPRAERVTWDGRAVVTRGGPAEVYRYEPPAPQTYLAPPPLAADLGGSRRKTGERLWVRDHYASYGTNPVVFAAHLPTAVHDLDGDGADDWLVCSENFYGVVGVKGDRDLAGPVVLSDALPGHWTAYSYPSLGKARPIEEPALLHNNAYALGLVTDLCGKPLWHHGLTRDTAGTRGILADLNGDGGSESVHAQPDGVIRCFDVGAPRSRCATCPPGTPVAEGPVSGGDPYRWSLDLGRPVGRMAAADLDGDGCQEILLGSSDGNLYALAERAGGARILWKVPLGRRVGEPVLADLDGDDRAEILVGAEDGRLYCLRGDRAAGE